MLYTLVFVSINFTMVETAGRVLDSKSISHMENHQFRLKYHLNV
jgi:hypothetical protein